MSEKIKAITTKKKKPSGGVKTAEGKAISRYNAQKHAILREAITEYEQADAEQFYNELAASINPNGRLQELIVENIASNAIRLTRIAKAEGEFIKEMLNPPVAPLDFGGYTSKLNSAAIEKLELYSRYQTATENRMFRSISFLRTLQGYGETE